VKSQRTKACDIPKKVKDAVWERDEGRCVNCHSTYAFPNAHYISRARNGLGIEQNIVTLCMKCHHNFDHMPFDVSEPIRLKIKDYLMGYYDDWNEENLIYKKWG